MKKLLLFMFALLTGVSGAWADNLTLVTAQDTWSGVTFYKTTGSATSGWGHTCLSNASASQPQVFINSNNAAESSGGFNCANGRHATGKTFYLNIQPGYKITGYSITFKSTSTSTTITAADGETSQTADGSTPQTLSVTGLSCLKTSYSVSGAGNAIISAYTITYEAVVGAKYRLMQCWNNNPTYFYYCYSTSTNKTIMYEHASPNGISLMDSYYIWAAENDNYKMKLKNMGSGYYVKEFSGTSNNYELLTSGTAEKIKIACNYNYGNYYTLQSTSSATPSYIDSYSSGNASRVNIHNALHQGDIFKFIPVKTVNFVNTSSAAQTITVTASDGTSGSYSTIYVAMDGSDSFTLTDAYLYSFDGGENYVYANEAATTIANTGISDMTVTVKANTTVTVDYYIYYGGSLVASQEDVTVYLGDPVVPSSLSRDYCNYQYYTTSAMDVEIETVTAGLEEIYVNATWGGPFDFSTDYASATWYYWKLTNKYVYYDTSTTPYPIIADKTDAKIQYSPYALWAFSGNPYDGIIVWNKAAGSSKCLSSYYGEPQMDSYVGSDEEWTITKQSDTDFSLKVGTKCLNNFAGNGYIRYWTDSAAPLNSGSALTIEPVTWKELAIADVTNYALNHAVGQYFGVDETEVNSTINQIKLYAGDFTEIMYNGVISGLSTLSINYPSTGYYLIHHAESSYYLGTNGSDVLLQSAVSPSNVVTLTKGEGNNYSIGVQGKYMRPNGKQNFLSLNDSPSMFGGKISAGYVELWVSDSYCILAQSNHNDRKAMGYSSYGTSTKWTIEDADGASFTVPLTNVGDYSYATLYLPFGATITGAKAYILTVSGEWAIPHEISEVPANTGVLLRAEGDVEEVTVTVKSAATADTEGNMLAGTNIEITTERSDGEYILGNGEDGLGFYQRKSGRKIGANKAYLQLDADLGVKGLLLNFDIATGIDGLTPDPSLSKKGEEIFNLAGQRMSRVQKGVNIVNGKKVLVK